MPLLSGFGLWWFGCVWSLLSSFILIEVLSDPHTHIKTSAMTHHSNSSVRDHMKWVSETSSPESESWIQCVLMLIHFSLSRYTTPLAFCFWNKSCGPLFVLWHVVCVVRLGCWVVRRCCPAWPWCKLTTSQARRRWCHHWVRGTGPVPRATTLTHSTATTTMDSRFTMDNHTTATWAILQQGAVHLWWEKCQPQLLCFLFCFLVEKSGQGLLESLLI